jgi:sugar transferase EpsL
MTQLLNRHRAKRAFDIGLLVALTPLIGPIILFTAIFVRFSLGRPIFFSQTRPGYRGTLFELRKFRTMTNECDESGALLSDSRRLTRVGKLLRSTSLDEFPGFFNVMTGDLSFVGPRPLLPAYLPLYSPQQMRRHDVRPGITGWAQVKGRNNLTWEEKFALDLWYVDHQSFWVDLKILFLTVWKVISRADISSEKHTTMPYFEGSTRTTDIRPPTGDSL